jgi:hypothetical protein
MIIDTERNQKFLSLAFRIQKNGCYNVYPIKNDLKDILNCKVYRAYDYINYKYIYSLKEISDIKICADNVNILPISAQVGHRKKMLSGEQITRMKMLLREGKTKRWLAKEFKVDEKTIRNYLKS